MKMPKFLKRKSFWAILILVIIVLSGIFIFTRPKGNGSIQTGTVDRKDIKQTVLATGQIVSVTDLQLSFQTGGVVKAVLVKEGDKTILGQTLVYTDQSSALASLTTAKGALAQAQANYAKLMAGATKESIQTMQDSIDSAKQEIENTYDGAMNTLNSAYTAIFNAFSVVTTIKDDYFSNADQPGLALGNARNDIQTSMQDVKLYLDKASSSGSYEDIDSAISKMVLTLNSVYNSLIIARTQVDQGVYYAKVSSTDKTLLDTQKTNINTSITSVKSLQHEIASGRIALQKAQNQLALTKAQATQAEIDAAKAQILSAEGQVASAQVTLNNTIISAPASGTITSVDVRPGELAVVAKEAIILQDTENLHTEADISEANIASLKLSQLIDYTFDALGPDKHFSGKILTINPSSTVISGVVNYRVKGSLENVQGVKPGMTANMTILVQEKKGALAVPSTAIIKKNNKNYVRIIDDQIKKIFHEVEVQTGLQADGGLVEIVSGLNEGQQVITYMK